MFYFTPLPGFFSPFPHGTGSLSVVYEYLVLRGGPRGFIRSSTCSLLLGIQQKVQNFQLQDYHFLRCLFPKASPNFTSFFLVVPQPFKKMKFRLFPFLSPLLRESLLLSFPLVNKMFQFTRFSLSYLCIR